MKYLRTAKLPGTPLLLAAATALLLSVAVAAALAPDGLRMALMNGFSALCHQLPERSFMIAGEQMALCHRCTSILGGTAMGLLVWTRPRLPLGALPVIVIALAPMGVDWMVDVAGIWSNTTLSRLLTGLWGGLALGGLIGSAARSERPVEPVPDAE